MIWACCLKALTLMNSCTFDVTGCRDRRLGWVGLPPLLTLQPQRIVYLFHVSGVIIIPYNLHKYNKFVPMCPVIRKCNKFIPSVSCHTLGGIKLEFVNDY